MAEPLLSNFAIALPEQAREEARLALSVYFPRMESLVIALDKVDVRDDEDLKRATDTIVLAVALRDQVDTLLTPISTPYREATHAIASVAGGFNHQLKAAELRARGSIASFRHRQREAAALAKNQQAEREAELRRQAGLETKSAPAPVKPSDIRLGSSRSDYRGQVFDRKVLKVTITDPRALPDTILWSPGVIGALETAVRKLAALDRNIPGAVIEDEQQSTIKAG